MRARIDGFQYGDGVLIALVGFYYTSDEDGYEEPKREKVKPWKLKEQEPFTILPFPTDYKHGLEDLKVSIFGQLAAFKTAHDKLPDYESWLGTELEITPLETRDENSI